MHGARRPDDNTRMPYQKHKPKVTGVRKFKELVYEGWRITLFRRDQGVQSRRIAYSARVTEIDSKISFYIQPADSQNLVIKSAKRQVDQRRERTLKEKKYYAINRVLNLWFRPDEETDAGLPSTMDTTQQPE